MSNKYKPGTKVSHSVYGDGTVTDVTEIGKHWSIRVDFEEGPRTVLNTFLTLKDVSEDIPEIEVLETVMAEAMVEPGTKVSHAIFGIGEVKDCKPKGKNYRLDIDFEDGTSKTLLSTFIEIVSDDSTEKDDDEMNDSDDSTEKDDDEMNDSDDENEIVEADSSMEKLEKLIERRKDGEVTFEEFEEMKKEILERKPQVRKDSVKIAQEEVHDDYIDNRNTIVKDSVVSKSSIGGGSSKMQELEKLKKMFDSDFISKKEMEKMKKEIIGK